MERTEDTASDEQLLRRIRSEYLEMPGLRLSREQAQRLWALDASTCARLLECLVASGFLHCGVDGRFGQGGEDHMHRQPFRMMKADIGSRRTGAA
jgi:hypothetical protein